VWLRELMDKYVKKCLDYILEGIIDNEITTPLLQTIPRTNLNLVTQLCSLLEAILSGDKKVSSMQVRHPFCMNFFYLNFTLYLKHRCILQITDFGSSFHLLSHLVPWWSYCTNIEYSRPLSV
jgi:hypothetical protein